MNHPQLTEICHRLKANVAAGKPDQCEQLLRLPAAYYADEDQWQREMRDIFLKVPSLVALTCDIPEPGDFQALTLVGRPILIVRGDDGRARVFLNVCRHRGAKVADEDWGNARRFTCPYHSWSYDRNGRLAGIPGADTFGEVDVEGLLELPSEERHGAVFACLSREVELNLDEWLGPMGESLDALRLGELYPYRKTTVLDSPNWKLAADGYLDGYHIGYLHRDSIGRKSITNRNTYDLFGPHVRIGFATKMINEFEASMEADCYLPDYMSLVHYVFPNVSISGGHGDTIQLSRLFPGPTVDRSTTVQHQYFREPVEGNMLLVAEEKRVIYERVVRDEDCATIFGISEALPALGEDTLLFGRNEPGNQRLHEVIRTMTGS